MFHNVWPFIGSLGRLVEVPFTASESVSRADRYVESVTVEGVRRVQVRPAAPRSWSVDVNGATAGELSALSAFTSGAWGPGPWHWVSVQARQGNLLTPREAGLLDYEALQWWSPGGPVRDAEGAWSARSISSSLTGAYGQLFNGIPVVAGGPVTWAADVQGDGRSALGLGFRDASGALIAGVYSDAVAPEVMGRVSMTVTVPDEAVSLHVGVRRGVTRVARPQVTWTAGPVPYSAGHGCRAAVVDGFSEDLIVANRFGTYSSAGFTVMEVG